MKRFLIIICAIILGFTPILGIATICLFVYDALTNIKGIILCSILMLISLFLAYKIFKWVLLIGPLKAISHHTSSSDLDNLKSRDGK